MNPSDPREDHTLLKHWETELEEPPKKEPDSPRRAKRPPLGAKCAKCGGSELSSMPTFSVGSGVSAKPFADDVRCHRCGHIAPPAL
jgi:hypothetical protein